LVRYTAEPLTATARAISSSLRPASAASNICALSLRAPRILVELICPKKAKALIDIYANHFSPNNHNAVSMSLYSGPASSRRALEETENWISEWQFSPQYGRRG
jgi:hypothetical protein